MYEVNVTREGKWWMVEVPEIDGLTQARRISEVEGQATSLIATMLDVAPSAVQIEITSITAGDIDVLAVAEAVKSARTRAAEAERDAADATASAARQLTNQAPVRDVGEILGLSHQRVSQIVAP